MLRRRLPVPKFNWSMSPRRAALGVGLFIILGALSAALVLLSDGRTQLTSAAPANEQMLLLCANGTVVPDAANQPGLVADCAALLEARDALRGTATLNWSAERTITSWTGVTVGTVSSAEGKRVTALDLDSRRLDGVIPASLGRLSALRNLRLGFNRLTGTIPVELGRLTSLGTLLLNGNHLSGTIPVELAEIGGTLTSLQLAGPNPLPEGVGLSGTIPPQLGNLTGLRHLNLSSNRLSGPIPPRLGLLVNLRWLTLNRNQLSGSIPTHLGQLRELTNLRLDDNQLSGVIPSQFGNFTRLRKVYLKRNTGFTGCAPSRLRDVRFTDFSSLNLPECADDAPATTATPEPTYTLTVTAGEGGAIDPPGVSTHTEAAPVILTASWNDATHTFDGWSGACNGTDTTCTLELYADATVSAAFTPLPADRCATPTDATCILAVYLGGPDDYAQVQDIPADLLIQPDSDGRYQVDRGQQYTVVTAAQLPTDWTRFYLERTPDQAQISPTTLMQLIPPVGTTYTFTVNSDERGANLLSFDLHAARPLPIQRPGIKPELGDIIVTTEFLVLKLRYDQLILTGAAITPGSYAFWHTDGSQQRALDTFGRLPRNGLALRIHPVDAAGTDQTAFYDTVRIGDTVDYQMNGPDCAFRFRVTSLSKTTTLRTIGLEFVVAYGGRCNIIEDSPNSDVWFVWRALPGKRGSFGARILIPGEPTGGGTFRISDGAPCTITVPAGKNIVYQGLAENEPDSENPAAQTDYHIFTDGGTFHEPDDDTENFSLLSLDADTYAESRRYAATDDADDFFDQIVSSIQCIGRPSP